MQNKLIAFLLVTFVTALCFIKVANADASENRLPRNVIALYDSEQDESVRENRIHRYLEMPLNYLGYTVTYHDVNRALPAFTNNDFAIAIWFLPGTKIKNPDAYLDWLLNGVEAGRNLIILENFGVPTTYRIKRDNMEKVNRLLKNIGLRDNNRWVEMTYEYSVKRKDNNILDFERKIETSIPPFMEMRKIGNDSISHLSIAHVSAPDSEIDLIVTSKKGGYIADKLAIYGTLDKESSLKLWYINPFKFLRLALGIEDKISPIPDVTTLAGKRILYSHIDGDGWNNLSSVEKFRGKKLFASEVIAEEILAGYPEIAFNVGIIRSEIDPKCYGVEKSLDIAKKILTLPNVEPSSHTHSHPLFWEYFAHGNNALREKEFLKFYPSKPSSDIGFFRSLFTFTKDIDWSEQDLNKALQEETKLDEKQANKLDYIVKKFFKTPRSYACEPFDKNLEIKDSIDFVNSISPEGKKVGLYQWSGDTAPFEEAIKLTREAGVLNLNGGDSRFDPEFSSYAWVSPIGINIGSETQIYSSNSNENTYTNLWTERYYGLKYLQNTVMNTESPIRIKPFNLYFHMFSGEKDASLKALRENLDFAKSLDLISISAKRYAEIADGFYKSSIVKTSDKSWKILNSNGLATIRFDYASDKTIDYENSKCIIGHKYHQASLYAYLDKSCNENDISIKNSMQISEYEAAKRPYLIESNAEVKFLHIDPSNPSTFSFELSGYKDANMLWKIPTGKNFDIKVSEKQLNSEIVVYNLKNSATNDNYLNIKFDIDSGKTYLIKVNEYQ